MVDEAGTNDYVTPRLIQLRESAAVEKAKESASGDISNPIVRDIIPELDFDEGEDLLAEEFAAGWDLTPDADEAGEYEVIEIDSDTGNSERRVHMIYGFEAVEGMEFVEQVNFRGSDGQIFERAKVTGLDETGDTAVDRQKTLRSVIGYDPQDNGTISIVVNDDFEEAVTDAGDEPIKLKLLGITAEKTGRRVGSRT